MDLYHDQLWFNKGLLLFLRVNIFLLFKMNTITRFWLRLEDIEGLNLRPLKHPPKIPYHFHEQLWT